MKPNRNFVISIIIRLVAFAVFYGSEVAGWEFLERFTNHVRHGKLAEGLGSHFSLQVFAVFELLLVFIPRPKWKAALIVLYAAFMSWQWSPPSYTPYRFLYHAVFGTVLMICAGILGRRDRSALQGRDKVKVRRGHEEVHHAPLF